MAHREKPYTGGGKDPENLDKAADERRRLLIEQLNGVRRRLNENQLWVNGKAILFAGLDSRYIAASHTPTALLNHNNGTPILAPWRKPDTKYQITEGYLFSVTIESLKALIKNVETPNTKTKLYDSAIIKLIETLPEAAYNQEKIENDWAVAADAGQSWKLFYLQFAPFQEDASQDVVLDKLNAFLDKGDVARYRQVSTRHFKELVGSTSSAPPQKISALPPRQAHLQRQKVSFSRPSTHIFGFSDPQNLAELISSGLVSRWEPVQQIGDDALPGSGPEPDPDDLTDDITNGPVVGVIDGGYSGKRYQRAVAWRSPPLIPDHLADLRHGNIVSSIVVEGDKWNNKLEIPDLPCRIGIVQAVPRPDIRLPIGVRDFVSHINDVMESHPETHVWNISANLRGEIDRFSFSTWAILLNRVARRHNKLLIISTGNRNGRDRGRIAPPSDCDAAIVVGGRQTNRHGKVGNVCTKSRRGPGPELQAKPDVSWFSEQRVLGGDIETGTSFAAPLIARVAAYTWQNLDRPSPDLVKALVLNACDLQKYDRNRGFGSPVYPERPWLCGNRNVIFGWSAIMRSGIRYTWTDIRIPPSLIRDGKFRGRAKLIAVLKPVFQSKGHLHYCTRIRATLQYRDHQGKIGRLAGPSNTPARESDARSEDLKWHSTRIYQREAKKGVSLSPSDHTLRVSAQVYWRNKFLFDQSYMNEYDHEVSFVVSLESLDENADIYNEFRQEMAESVEVGVLEEEVEYEEEV